MNLESFVGAAAAICTTGSYFPQLKKCWQTRHAGDLSLKMMLILMSGLSLWVVYGVMRSDYAIIAANTVSVATLLGILYVKLTERPTH